MLNILINCLIYLRYEKICFKNARYLLITIIIMINYLIIFAALAIPLFYTHISLLEINVEVTFLNELHVVKHKNIRKLEYLRKSIHKMFFSNIIQKSVLVYYQKFE